MKERVFGLLDYIFLLAIGYTLYGAVRSSVLHINLLHQIPFAILLIILIGILCIFYSRKTKSHGKRKLLRWITFFSKHRVSITIGLFLTAFILQMILLRFITAPMGWDVGHIYSGVTSLPEDSEGINRYLSINPNNSFFSFVMYGMTQLINRLSTSRTFGDTWLAWQLVNTQFLNLGFLFIFAASKELFNKDVAYFAFYLAFIPLALSPWLLVPYTDITIIPVVGFVFWLYAKVCKSKGITLKKGITVILLGVTIAIAFLLKPSSIVFLIAWVIIRLIEWLDEKDKTISRQTVFILFAVMIGAFGTIGSFRIFESKQSIVEIDEEMAKPWSHFVVMGLTGDGGYNSEDSIYINSLPNQEEKREHTRQEIIRRLSDHGFIGYIQFLMEKHHNNTDRGDFGWGTDGGDQEPENPSGGKIQEILRDMYYQQGNNVGTIRFFMQLCWIVTLLGLSFISRKNDYSNHLRILKLGILGAFLFLLLFEGGRSRYLLQYIPMFYLLSANGIYAAFIKWKKGSFLEENTETLIRNS